MARRLLRVFVYRNLNEDTFSVRDVSIGRVTAHADDLLLLDAFFKVSEAGRQRVLRTGRKNVHAGVEGTLVIEPEKVHEVFQGFLFLREVRYNPTRGPHFTDHYGRAVLQADVVWLKGGRVYTR